MKLYAVIDTNVLVSALLSAHPDSATVIVRDKILGGTIVPLFNDEILSEYKTVLGREKFNFPEYLVDYIIDAIKEQGTSLERIKSQEFFPDPKDAVFYEIAISKEGSYLVTGNTKHFPKSPIVVTPAEMVDIINSVK